MHLHVTHPPRGHPRYANLHKLLKDNLSEASYMGIVRAHRLVTAA